jgi:hypothetical protein
MPDPDFRRVFDRALTGLFREALAKFWRSSCSPSSGCFFCRSVCSVWPWTGFWPCSRRYSCSPCACSGDPGNSKRIQFPTCLEGAWLCRSISRYCGTFINKNQAGWKKCIVLTIGSKVNFLTIADSCRLLDFDKSTKSTCLPSLNILALINPGLHV